MITSLRQRTHRILHNSRLQLEILPLPCLSSSHDKCTSAREAEEISSLRVPEALPHSLFELKNCKLFCKLCCYVQLCCAASLLLLQATSRGTSFRDGDNLVHALACPFPSPWTHDALQVGISLKTGNFQSHNFILALGARSATSLLETKALFIQFENMSSLSLTSIPTLFERQPSSLLVIFSFIWWKSPLL